MSSAAMKGIVIWTTTPDVYKQRLLKGKYLDQTHHLHLFKHQNTSFFGVIRPRCGRVGVITACSYSNGNNMSSSRQKRLETRAQAILTPVSDPTPTMKKVYSLFFFLLSVQ